MRLLTIVGPLACIVVAFLWFFVTHESEPIIGDPIEVTVIDVSQQSEPLDLASILLDRSEPTVYRGWSKLSKWKAFDKWTPTFVAQMMADDNGLLQVKQQSDSPNFVLASPGKSVHWPFKIASKYTMVNASAVDMFAESRPPSSFQYYAAELTNEEMLNDVESRMLEFQHPVVKKRDDLAQLSLSRGVVWLAQRGVRASWHHDRSYNCFVQISGAKRWHFSRADAAAATMFPFPIVHPSRRQAQRNFDTKSDSAMFGSNRNSQWYVANLIPGDLLVTPPFWFHEVEAMADSVSFSVLSPSEHEVLFSNAQFSPVPFNRMRVGSDRALAVCIYIDTLLRAIGKDSIVFMKELLRTRYAPLRAILNKDAPQFASFDCLRRKQLVAQQARQRLEPEFSRAIAIVKETFTSKPFDVDHAARDTLVADLCDELLTFAADLDPRDTFALLQQCW
jgi:hypothetical protein